MIQSARNQLRFALSNSPLKKHHVLTEFSGFVGISPLMIYFFQKCDNICLDFHEELTKTLWQFLLHSWGKSFPPSKCFLRGKKFNKYVVFMGVGNTKTCIHEMDHLGATWYFMKKIKSLYNPNSFRLMFVASINNGQVPPDWSPFKLHTHTANILMSFSLQLFFPMDISVWRFAKQKM